METNGEVQSVEEVATCKTIRSWGALAAGGSAFAMLLLPFPGYYGIGGVVTAVTAGTAIALSVKAKDTDCPEVRPIAVSGGIVGAAAGWSLLLANIYRRLT